MVAYLWKLIREIWTAEKMIEEWKEAVICPIPIHKKRK